jgi:hypothetical protein
MAASRMKRRCVEFWVCLCGVRRADHRSWSAHVPLTRSLLSETSPSTNLCFGNSSSASF